MSFTVAELNYAIEEAEHTLIWGDGRRYNRETRQMEQVTKPGWEENYDRIWREMDYSRYAVVLNGNLYEIESVYHDGGGEGHAEAIETVIKVDGRLFRKTGYYASHDGEYWDGDLEEVEAYEKTVTDYRRI